MSEQESNQQAIVENTEKEPEQDKDQSLQAMEKSKTLEAEWREAKMLIQSGLLPKRFDTPQKVMTAYRFAKESGLHTLTAMRQMAVINGTPSFYGDLPLSIVLNKNLLESIDEYLITDDYERISVENKNLNAEPWAGVCIVKRKGDDSPCERYFTMEDAKRANLLKNPVWKQYAHRMLIYRARSQALKDKFADCLNGVAIAEYDFNGIEKNGEILGAEKRQDKEEKVKELNDKFS